MKNLRLWPLGFILSHPTLLSEFYPAACNSLLSRWCARGLLHHAEVHMVAHALAVSDRVQRWPLHQKIPVHGRCRRHVNSIGAQKCGRESSCQGELRCACLALWASSAALHAQRQGLQISATSSGNYSQFKLARLASSLPSASQSRLAELAEKGWALECWTAGRV